MKVSAKKPVIKINTSASSVDVTIYHGRKVKKGSNEEKAMIESLFQQCIWIRRHYSEVKIYINGEKVQKNYP